jgi:hypothetical protein
MMKKIDMILKKAALFERLSLYDERKDFLKSAQSTQHLLMVDEYGNSGPVTALDFLDKFKELVQYAQSILSLVPQDQKNSQEATRASSILKDPNIDIYKLKEAIDKLSIIAPLYSNSLIKKFNILKLMQDSLSLGSTHQTTEQAAQTPASAPKPAQSIDALFNFYYAKLQEAQKSSDSKTAQSFVPKMERVITRLDDMSAKLVISNPRENTRLSQLADKGRYLVQQVRNQFNMTQNPPASWLETSAMRRVLAQSQNNNTTIPPNTRSAKDVLINREKIKEFQYNILKYTEKDPNFAKLLSDMLNKGGLDPSNMSNRRPWSNADIDGKLGPRTELAWETYKAYTGNDPEYSLKQQNTNTDNFTLMLLLGFRQKLGIMRNYIAQKTDNFNSTYADKRSDDILKQWLPTFHPEYTYLYNMKKNNMLTGPFDDEFTSLVNYMNKLASGYSINPGPEPQSVLTREK